MIRNLVIIAVASFVLTVACFAGVAALGGRDLIEHGWSIPASVFDDEEGDVHISVGGKDDAGPPRTRVEDWDVGATLSVDLPADVSYRPGAVGEVTITGPQALVDRVVIHNGSLRWADTYTVSGGRHLRYNRDRLRISVVGPSVKRFVLNGSQELSITGYDQPDLAVEINGPGTVSAAGKAQALTLAIAGSGDANLADLAVRDATVSIAGSGDAELSPTGAARVDIAGSGDVTLTVKPASLSSNIDGSGDLHLPE